MTDLSRTIAPKSDQLNADDLIGRTLTIKVTKVSLMAEPDQPVAINFEGDNGKPYKPCKSMRRVLVTVWGHDGNAYIGRRMTLFRDDKVQFGGVAVGGIRISHMSDIERDVTMALTATRANRRPYTVKPLPAEPPSSGKPAGATQQDPRERLFAAARQKARQGSFELASWIAQRNERQKEALRDIEDELNATADEADGLADSDADLAPDAAGAPATMEQHRGAPAAQSEQVPA